MIYRPKNTILALVLEGAELCLFAFDRLFFFFCRSIPPKQDNKLLIVRLDAIGDFVIWLAAAKEIRNFYSGYQVTLLGNDLWTDLAQELPWFDAVWPLNRKRFLMNPFYRLKMLNAIRRGGFTIVLHTVFNRDFFVGDSSVRATGASHRIGFEGSTENIKAWHKRISDAWYTALVPSGQKHQLAQDADFVEHLGSKYTARLPHLPRFPLPKKFPLNDYYVIIPGAGHEMRQWPLQNFQEIARRVYKKTGLLGVLCGGKREAALSRSFLADADYPVMDLIGHTSLLDLAAIIAHAKVVIGNDTGAIHIAVAAATPSLCILGGAHPGRYLPYPPDLNAPVKTVMHSMDCFNCDWHCIDNSCTIVPCIDNISVDDVWKDLSGIL